MKTEGDSLVSIPGLDVGEIAVVESLLQEADIPYLSLPGSQGHEPELLINSSDLTEVKRLLKDFTTVTLNGVKAPIPW